MLDGGMTHGRRNYWRSDNLTTVTDVAIDTLLERAASATSPHTQIILAPMGGAVGDVPEDAMAIGGRSAGWQYHCYGTWEDGEDARHIEWVRGTQQAMRPYGAGRISINFVSDANHDRVRAAFGEDKYRRLQALKDRFDPENVFRLNQNVLPSGR
jgi:FAD/FMN-containing dehydrogenase